MKRFIFLAGVFAVIASLLLVSCEKNLTGLNEDQVNAEASLDEAINDEENDYLFDWGVDDGSEDNLFDFHFNLSMETGFYKPTDLINNVVRFGRVIRHRFPRTLLIRRINRDSAFVFVERVLEGRFVIVERIQNDTTDVDTLAIYRKPLRHIVRRKAIFVKKSANEPGRGHWKIQAISLSQGNSPHSTIHIDRIVVRNSQGDTLVFTDPLKTMLTIPDDVPVFHAGEIVTIQVYLSNETENPIIFPEGGGTETVLLHYARNRRHHGRKLFHYVGEDPTTGLHIYEGSWRVQENPRFVYHAIVDVIDNGTIFDNDPEKYPYNSVTWGCPYLVK